MKPFKSYFMRQEKFQINELFDKPARWRVKSTDEFSAVYESRIDGKELRVNFNKDLDTEDSWGMWFAVDNDLSVTGRGSEMKVFATVLDILGDFFKNQKPSELLFSAAKSVDSYSNSRVRLYDRLVRRFASSHGYRLRDTKDIKSEILYTLVRK